MTSIKKECTAQNTRGFTLIELLVAVIIIIILTIMAVPSLRDTLGNSNIRAAAETFAQQVQLTRSEAIQLQKTVYLSLVTGSQWCSGVNATTACTCSPTNNCGLDTMSYSDYSGITLTTPSGFTGGSISFDNIRALPNQAAQASFQANTKTITVSINAIGQVTYCSTNVPGYTAC